MTRKLQLALLMFGSIVVVLPGVAWALSTEQAREQCRATVGRAFVQQCKGGDDSKLEACRAKASSVVKPCVAAALNKANGRANVAITTDDGKGKKEAINLGNALPAGFVPPPRSIADIA